MSRKCSKCQGEMIENLSLVPDDVWGGLRIYKEGVENLKCFVRIEYNHRRYNET